MLIGLRRKQKSFSEFTKQLGGASYAKAGRGRRKVKVGKQDKNKGRRSGEDGGELRDRCLNCIIDDIIVEFYKHSKIFF